MNVYTGRAFWFPTWIALNRPAGQIPPPEFWIACDAWIEIA